MMRTVAIGDSISSQRSGHSVYSAMAQSGRSVNALRIALTYDAKTLSTSGTKFAAVHSFFEWFKDKILSQFMVQKLTSVQDG
jgi:hypothetical protein